MSARTHHGTTASAFLALAFAAAGCIKGVGEPCQFQGDCEPGLVCDKGACATCGNGVECLAVDLVVKSCDDRAQPLDGVGALRVTLTGDGIEPVVATIAKTAGALKLPQTDFCRNCMLLVEGIQTETNPVVVASGRSAHFDLDPEQKPQSIVVYLRRAGLFTPANRAISPGNCSQLQESRAGHTATPLPDGRVLVVGGYTLEGAGCATATPSCFRNTTEIYDPKTGEFTLGPSLKRARWGHTATLLPGSGRVLVAGGQGIINDKPTPLSVAEVFDPPYTGEPRLFPMQRGRFRHAAAALSNGVVLLSGGFELASDTSARATTEAFSPASNTFQDGPSLGTDGYRADHAAVAVEDANNIRVLVLGGVGKLDGTSVRASVQELRYTGGADFVLVEQTTPPKWALVTGGRARPGAFRLAVGDARGVLVVGTPASGGTSEKDAWDWLSTVDGAPPPVRDIKLFPVPRKDACAAAFEGGVLVAGGRSTTGELLATSDIYTVQPDGQHLRSDRLTDAALLQKRARAACATLEDGTVLVVGGETTDAGNAVTSAVAQFYQPN